MATEGMWRVAVAGILGGLVGAKLSQLLSQGWPVSIPWFVALDPAAGGKSLLGGLLVGWMCVEIAKRRLGIRRSTGDMFALALPAAEAVGRIGCYFNGCCFGTETQVPWAIHQHGAWRHPSQLYLSASAMLIFLGLLYARRRLSREGDLFKLYLILFGSSRFLIEFFRSQTTYLGGLSPMQWFCLELVVGTLGVLIVRARRTEGVAV